MLNVPHQFIETTVVYLLASAFYNGETLLPRYRQGLIHLSRRGTGNPAAVPGQENGCGAVEPAGRRPLLPSVGHADRAFENRWGLADGLAEAVDKPVVDTLERVAKERGRSMAQEALAWMLNKPEITAPIVGATSVKHIEEAVAALDIRLDEDEVKALEAPYVPHVKTGMF